MSETPSSGSSEGLGATMAIVAMFWIAGTAWAWFNLAAFPGFHPVERGLVFNEMLTQLLKGRFDISPATIGWEGFVRGGRTYAYFGIFCALLRAPLLIFGDIRTTDITSASLLVATVLSLACRLGAVGLVFAGARLDRGLGSLRTVVLAAVAFSGESVQFLRPSVYQEVVSWGDALAAGFVLLLAWVVFGRPRRTAMVHAGMAVLAGLALMCRVSFGVGLYAALGLVMGARLWLAIRGGEPWARTVRQMTPAVIVAGVLAILTLTVNYARWGDPFSFVPLELNTGPNLAYAERLPRLARYGEFNLLRVPFALQYYFAPIWQLTRHNGELLFQAFQLRLFEDVELPPDSLLLTDPVTCVFAAVGAFSVVFRPRLLTHPLVARAALAGLVVSFVLMLGAISLTFRYRMDLYPALDFACWLGLAAVIERGDAVRRRFVNLLRLAAVVGVVATMASRLLYLISPFGPATDFPLSHGVAAFYRAEVSGGAKNLPLPKRYRWVKPN